MRSDQITGAQINWVIDIPNTPAVVYITGKEGEITLDNLSDKPYSLCVVQVEDWDRWLTPWPAKDCLKGREFTGEGEVFLRELEQVLQGESGPLYLAGYSLAGLFALWALSNSTLFRGVACMSGSLWYPGFEEYMKKAKILTGAKVYLSLGNKEARTKHPLLGRVEELTLMQYEYLKDDSNVVVTFYEQNEGGHFNAVNERIRKGIGWLIKEMRIL